MFTSGIANVDTDRKQTLLTNCFFKSSKCRLNIYPNRTVKYHIKEVSRIDIVFCNLTEFGYPADASLYHVTEDIKLSALIFYNGGAGILTLLKACGVPL